VVSQRSLKKATHFPQSTCHESWFQVLTNSKTTFTQRSTYWDIICTKVFPSRANMQQSTYPNIYQYSHWHARTIWWTAAFYPLNLCRNAQVHSSGHAKVRQVTKVITRWWPSLYKRKAWFGIYLTHNKQDISRIPVHSLRKASSEHMAQDHHKQLARGSSNSVMKQSNFRTYHRILGFPPPMRFCSSS
jgi:hypothetical protein